MRATQSRAKLRDMLGAEIVPDDHKAVPRKFAEDFELVAKHYGLNEVEYAEAKAAARADLESAIVTFASLAGEVRYQPDDYDLTQRDEI